MTQNDSSSSGGSSALPSPQITNTGTTDWNDWMVNLEEEEDEDSIMRPLPSSFIDLGVVGHADADNNEHHLASVSSYVLFFYV